PTSTTASTTTTTRPTTTTTTPADLQDERAAGIVELVEDGVDLGVWTFEDTLAIDLADAFAAGAAPRFVVVSDAAWVDEASAALAGDVLVPLLEELADVDEMALAVVAETSPAAYPVIEVDEAEGGEEDGGGEEAEGGPEGRSLAITVRTTPEMAERVSTVDDVDRFAGAVALVLALEDLPDRVGAYGVRPSATALVPPP
ncbi:MAG: copper transporter, partial [Actinomycetota bacterium]|nr:copper transporter [Actinomycetota bacterium]